MNMNGHESGLLNRVLLIELVVRIGRCRYLREKSEEDASQSAAEGNVFFCRLNVFVAGEVEG
jgi:hypothetical protein